MKNVGVYARGSSSYDVDHEINDAVEKTQELVKNIDVDGTAHYTYQRGNKRKIIRAMIDTLLDEIK